MRKSKFKPILIVLIILIIAGAGAYAFKYFMDKQASEYEAKITKMENEINSSYQTVYVATKDIKAGETLEEYKNVEVQNIMSALDSDMLISDDDLGKVLRISISEGSTIPKTAVTSAIIAQDTREVELNTISLMTDQNEEDVIDIRVLFPNGEDYLVLPKKSVKNLSLANSTFFTLLNEEEILRLSCCLIDSYLTTGTKIYAVRYAEPELQDSAIPNYPVTAQTIDLINSDPNILTKATQTMSLIARMSLEERLGAMTEEQLSAVATGNSLADSAKNTVVSTKEQVSDEYIEEVY